MWQREQDERERDDEERPRDLEILDLQLAVLDLLVAHLLLVQLELGRRPLVGRLEQLLDDERVEYAHEQDGHHNDEYGVHKREVQVDGAIAGRDVARFVEVLLISWLMLMLLLLVSRRGGWQRLQRQRQPLQLTLLLLCLQIEHGKHVGTHCRESLLMLVVCEREGGGGRRRRRCARLA